MQIRITVPDALISQAEQAGMGTEDYVEQLLNRIAAGNPDRLRAEILADWDHYQTTGLHLSGEEVDDWLDRLQKGETSEPPALHA